MAFSSQSFRAPKINKGNFSSPLSSSASKISGSISAPKLNTTKISFIKKENSPIVEAVNNNAESLTQTNEILIEIQKQLAFDFANRIAEEKEAIRKIKAEESRRRFGEEEKAVEGTNKIKKGLFGAFNKVIAPARGIFDKLFEFFSILLTGFLGNKAFDWLKNPENREKITSILNWIGKNWKILTGLFVIGKLLGPIGLLIKFARLLAKLFRRGGGLGPDKLKRIKDSKPPKPGGGGIDCNKVLKCIEDNPVRVLKSLGMGILAGGAAAGGAVISTLKSPKGDMGGRVGVGDLSKYKQSEEPVGGKVTTGELAGISSIAILLAALLSSDPSGLFALPFLSRFKPLKPLRGIPDVQRLQNAAKLQQQSAIRSSGNYTNPMSRGNVANAAKQQPDTPIKFQSQSQKPSFDSIISNFERALLKPTSEVVKNLSNRSNPIIKKIKNDPSKTLSDQIKRNAQPPKDVKIIKSKGFEGSTNFGLLPFAGLFTLPTVKSTPPPGPAPVANESVSINPTNTNNPYMMITPEIYGMYAF